MKNVNSKTLIFYTFQLENKSDYNVTSLKIPSPTPTIREILLSLPFDLSTGIYHFRFKTQFVESDEKILGWIDINNLNAKVPMVNGAIYVKILTLKCGAYNKNFTVEKLKKADIISKNSKATNGTNGTPKKKPIEIIQRKQQPQKIQTQPPKQQQKPINNQHQTPKIASKTPSQIPNKQQDFINLDSPPKKSCPPPATAQQKQQIFNKQFDDEQAHKQSERLAKIEFQQKIEKWGYSGGKTVNNITTLLSTCQDVWPQWKPISLSDMLKPEQTAAIIKKAKFKFHPDKNRNRHPKEKYLSKRIFELLNEASKNM